MSIVQWARYAPLCRLQTCCACIVHVNFNFLIAPFLNLLSHLRATFAFSTCTICSRLNFFLRSTFSTPVLLQSSARRPRCKCRRIPLPKSVCYTLGHSCGQSSPLFFCLRRLREPDGTATGFGGLQLVVILR